MDADATALDAADSPGANDGEAGADNVGDRDAGTGEASTDAGPDSSGDPDEGPLPGPDDRIVVDTRVTLQQATDLQSALAAFGMPLEKNGTWNFVTDADGAGTHAMRLDLPSFNGVCNDSGGMLLRYLSELTPRPKRMYFRWKHRLGKAPSDPGGSGTDNTFQITNAACDNAGAKRFLILRDVPDKGASGRTDLIWFGPATTIPGTTEKSATPGFASDTLGLRYTSTVWWPQQHVGKVFTETIYFQASSTDAAADGVLRYWVDGQLVVDKDDVPLRSAGIDRFQFPTTFRAPAMDQSEYYWDFVAWVPTN